MLFKTLNFVMKN